MKECLTETSFVCKSIDYSKGATSKYCILSTEDLTSVDLKHGDWPNAQRYQPATYTNDLYSRTLGYTALFHHTNQAHCTLFKNELKVEDCSSTLSLYSNIQISI